MNGGVGLLIHFNPVCNNVTSSPYLIKLYKKWFKYMSQLLLLMPSESE